MGKENNAKKRNIKTYNFLSIEADKRLEEQLRKSEPYRTLTKEELASKEYMIELAQQCYDNGLTYDELPAKFDQYKSNHFFKVGYEIAKRKVLIEEQKLNKKTR